MRRFNKDIEKNERTKREILLYLGLALERPAQTFGGKDSREKVVGALRSKYGLTAKQAGFSNWTFLVKILPS